ncbi:MAG: hypothetical protein M0Z51_04305 [Propionibacterium sp.]|nr:hypothetical protein [Propionibacterium sp.]
MTNPLTALSLRLHLHHQIVTVTRRRVPDERGLSQSTESAILLAGAVTIALIVIAAITAYVTKHLPS